MKRKDKMATIQFIEKEPWQNQQPYTGGCDMFPTYMVKDGVEYFMFNRRSDQTKYDAELNEARKKQLLDNDGKFFKFYGYMESPHEYLRCAIKGRNSFDKFGHKEVEWVDDGNFCDFHGNVREVSAAFHYRIYDKNMAVNIEKIVNLIHEKKYDVALTALNEYSNIENITVSLGDKIKSASERIVSQPETQQHTIER